MEGLQDHLRGRRRRGRGDDSAVNGRLTALILMMSRHILTQYFLFFPTKTFSFLRWVHVVRGWGTCRELKYIPPPPPPTNCHTLLEGKGDSIFLYLSLYLLSIPFSLISLPFFLQVFNGLFLYLSCPHNLLFISFAPILAKGWLMDLTGEGTVDKWGEKNDNSWVLEPGQGRRFKVWTKFSTLSTLFFF